MLLIASAMAIVGAIAYFIRVGGKLNEAKLSDEAIRDIKKIYKMEAMEDERIKEKLDGNSSDPNSIASLFPTELRNGQKVNSKDVHPTNPSQD